MNKYLMYAIIAIIVLAGLGYLAFIIKTALKFIILGVIIIGAIWGFKILKKKFNKT